jgi:histidyl-tRNA synthetase
MSTASRPAPAAVRAPRGPKGFVRHAAEVAASYGFRPVAGLAQEARHNGATLERVRTHTFETVSAVCAACAVGGPALGYWASPSPSFLPPGARHEEMRGELGEFGLTIAGTPESIGEVLMLKALSTIVEEWGAPVSAVRLNALGDRDSKVRYGRELSYYFRKHADELCESCRGRIAHEPTAPFSCLSEQCRAVASGAPRAMNFLSEKSRVHFREVLEHIEGLGLSYELDDLLVESRRESQILFAINVEGDQTLEGAFGGRFDDHLRRTTGRKDAAGVSASLYFRKKGLAPGSFASPAPARAPKVFFVQLGLRAKMSGLSVLDELRRAGVPVLQSFDASRLQPQLEAAKAAGVSHLIIMGQREALDGTVIVRELADSSQTTIEVRALPRYLRALR